MTLHSVVPSNGDTSAVQAGAAPAPEENEVKTETNAAPAETSSQPEPAAPLPTSTEPLFFVVGDSRVGEDHISGNYRGNGNQDCRGFREVPLGMIAVSCDGCGSTPDSSTGSRAAVRIILNVCEQLLAEKDIPSPKEFAKRLEAELLERIKQAATPLARDGDLNSILHQSYLFTLKVAVVTPIWTAIFSCGDGYYAINTDPVAVSPREGNMPEYIAYKLYRPPMVDFQDVCVSVVEQADTLKVDHILVATDGIAPFGNKRREVSTSGDRARIRDFFTRSDFYRNPHMIAAAMEHLTTTSSELVTERAYGGDAITIKLKEKGNPFHDDVTFVIMVRNPKVALPTAWAEYRDARLPRPQSQVQAAPAATAPQPATPAEQTAPQAATAEAVKPEAKQEAPAPTTEPVKESWLWSTLKYLWNLLTFAFIFDDEDNNPYQKQTQQKPESTTNSAAPQQKKWGEQRRNWGPQRGGSKKRKPNDRRSDDSK